MMDKHEVHLAHMVERLCDSLDGIQTTLWWVAFWLFLLLFNVGGGE